MARGAEHGQDSVQDKGLRASRGGGHKRGSAPPLAPPSPRAYAQGVSRTTLSEAVAAAARALHQRQWVANHDGNVSVRVGERVIVTPTAVSKADVLAHALAVVDAAGKVVEGELKPPSEVALHLAIYAARDDVHAVVHAHPPHATALACAGLALDVPFLPEAVVSLGTTVPLTPFALPFGEEGAAPLRSFAPDHDAVLLTNHGVLTWGATVEQALLRMELVEHLARITILARSVGGVRPLPATAIASLLERRRKAGLGKAAERAGLLSEGPAVAPTPTAPGAWKPAGPPPAPDAWSGGAVEAACGRVYGAGDAPVGARSDDLGALVLDEVRRQLRP